MIRARFKSSADDIRPIGDKWDKQPWWCTGHCGDDSGAIIVAYAENEAEIMEKWPEAEDIDSEEAEEYFFNSRFPRPEWFKGDD